MIYFGWSPTGRLDHQVSAPHLYVTRGNKLHLAGFFSAKLRGSQVSWLPCEIEALSIATATKHFSPYTIQSNYNACILTDSKPCVQAFEKLCRGEFSSSPRVSTFLSVVSCFQASVRHVSSAAILPSDFTSHNTPLAKTLPAKFAPLFTVPKSLWFAKPLFRTFSTAMQDYLSQPVHLG